MVCNSLETGELFRIFRTFIAFNAGKAYKDDYTPPNMGRKAV